MKLIFCGDTISTNITQPAFDSGDLKSLMGDSLQVFSQADFTIINLEGALTNSEARIRKLGPNLKGKPEYAKVLRDCGVTHVGLSNNHTLDFGEEGLDETVKACEANGMVCFGYGKNDTDSRKPLIIEKDGIKVAVIAVCEHEYTYALPNRAGANPFDPFDTMDDIFSAKVQADYVVVLYHGGKELCQYPSPRLRKACRAMVTNGADLVLCQHSHCIGSRERFKGSDIVYGTGNFNFVEDCSVGIQASGLMVTVEADAEELKANYIPVVVTKTGVDLAKGEEKLGIMKDFEDRSAILDDEDAWMKKWEEFCFSPNQSYYMRNLKEAFTEIPEGEICEQHFPHYLDCEAHTDVIKTIYKTWHHNKRK